MDIVTHVDQEVLRGRKAQRKNQMARNHVGEESDRQRERADHQQLKQLDRAQQNVDRPRHTLREELVAQEMAEALFADASGTTWIRLTAEHSDSGGMNG